MAETSYTFRKEHRPTLLAGAYKVTATWDAAVNGASQAKASRAVDFYVAGERFSLNPADIHSAYPAEGSRGAFGESLPHIALTRDTLPWERAADGKSAPWLALLVLHESEAAQARLRAIPVKDYIKDLPAAPPFAYEPGQTPDDLVQVIDLPANLLQSLLPDIDHLSTLCHVRAKGDGGAEEENVAVVVSRRLPGKGRNTAHLVSLENRYGGASFAFSGKATATLVSLKSWSFTCEESEHAESESLARIFSALRCSWLRLPFVAEPAARVYVDSGFVPVPHRFRTSESGASWYSGPLIPMRERSLPAGGLTLPATCADQLLGYDESLGMLNIAYAAAWELGRALVLQNRRVQTLLQQWRRQQILREHARQAALDTSACCHLPQVQRACCDPAAPPEELTAWIDGLRRLQGVPLKYLAPDERMLPMETLGFFAVDAHWIDALLDGALSLARTPTVQEDCCRKAEEHLLGGASGKVTGFLLRSKAVAGWPGLTMTVRGIDAKDVPDQTLPLLRMERLSPSILLCLFKGRVTSITVRQPTETLHLALKTPADAPALWTPGRKIWKDETLRVLDLTALTDSSGAGFAQHFLHQQQTLEASVQWS